MDKYISNLLPRLRKYGKQLNKKEEFVDKTWVLFASGNIITYRFKRNGVLRKTIDGDYYDLHWELEGLDAIAISGESKRSGEIFNHGFVLDGLLVVQKEGRSVQPVIFYNKDVVRDGDVVKYIREVIMEKEHLSPIDENGKYYTSHFGVGEKGTSIYDADICPVVDEEIWIHNFRLIVKNGRVIQKDYVVRVNTNKGELLVLANRYELSKDNFKVGDEVLNSIKRRVKDDVYKIVNSKVIEITVRDGQIVSLNRKRNMTQIVLIILYLLLVVILVWYSMRKPEL